MLTRIISNNKSMLFLLLAFITTPALWAFDLLPSAKPVPLMQIIPMPYDQASFQRDGVEIARYHFGPTLKRPFVFPVIGPAGRSLTRMGHPRDPESHSHHNSVWISHNEVNGVVFWGDRGKGTIRHKRIVDYIDEGDEARVITDNDWIDKTGTVLLKDTRRYAAHDLLDGEWLLTIDLELKAPDHEVTLGKTPFGMLGVRMAKTIGVHDGGGKIRNSEGGVNEKEILWNRAKWVDYSGPITNEKIEGITLFDHPSNPNHPTYFHVRGDGWMGASLTYDGAMTIHPVKSVHLRYALYIHNDFIPVDKIEKQWERFTHLKPGKKEQSSR